MDNNCLHEYSDSELSSRDDEMVIKGIELCVNKLLDEGLITAALYCDRVKSEFIKSGFTGGIYNEG